MPGRHPKLGFKGGFKKIPKEVSRKFQRSYVQLTLIKTPFLFRGFSKTSPQLSPVLPNCHPLSPVLPNCHPLSPVLPSCPRLVPVVPGCRDTEERMLARNARGKRTTAPCTRKTLFVEKKSVLHSFWKTFRRASLKGRYFSSVPVLVFRRGSWQVRVLGEPFHTL